MGYTHYWDQKKSFTPKQWKGILDDAKSILELNKIPVEDLHLTEDVIRFNGVGDDGHETFIVKRMKSQEFNFCKTAQKPYDLLVGLVLARINHYAKGVLAISSDGDWESDWAEIRERYKSLFGSELQNWRNSK